jgi:hypothetical protein
LMRCVKLILILVFIFIFFLIFGCYSYNKDGTYYYENIYDASEDINDGCVGRRSQRLMDNPNVAIVLLDGRPTICLLTNIITDTTILLNNASINLNGFTLTNDHSTLIKTYGDCEIYNGFLHRSCNDKSCTDGLVIGKSSVCKINNVVFKSESNNETNVAIRVYGEVIIRNSTIETHTIVSNQNTTTISVYGNIFSRVCIEESNIFSEADFGRVDGVYVGDVGSLVNSNIIACANYQSNSVRFTSCAIGCNNSGTLVVNNCSIYGVHSGINSVGALFVDGGTYSGYGHGGIYCAGINWINVIINSTVLQAEMPYGYEDLGVGCMQGGLYIGGGEHRNNVTVFIDNCIIEATKNPIVLRGTSGEQNNSLYISNTTIDIQHIRVDNNTHHIYLGEGCNFGLPHIDIPEVVIYTGVSYTTIKLINK